MEEGGLLHCPTPVSLSVFILFPYYVPLNSHPVLHLHCYTLSCHSSVLRVALSIKSSIIWQIHLAESLPLTMHCKMPLGCFVSIFRNG